MKKSSFKGFIAGFVVCSILSTGLTVFGETSQTIQAVFGRVKLVVNGSNVDKETLLYNGTTYLPLRDVAEITGLNVDWDSDTNVATLSNTKSENSSQIKQVIPYEDYPEVPDYGKMFGVEPLMVQPKNGNISYAYLLDSATNENYKMYIKSLEALGFEYDQENDVYSTRKTVVSVMHNIGDTNYDAILIVPIK